MGGVKKTLLQIRGKPVLLHALQPFLGHPALEAMVVALPPEDAGDPPEWLTAFDPRIRVVAGESAAIINGSRERDRDYVVAVARVSGGGAILAGLPGCQAALGIGEAEVGVDHRRVVADVRGDDGVPGNGVGQLLQEAAGEAVVEIGGSDRFVARFFRDHVRLAPGPWLKDPTIDDC